MAEKATRASYKIAYELGRHGLPFTAGEVVKDCMIIAAEELCPAEVLTLSKISLSRDIVASRTKDIGDGISRELKELSAKFVKFSIALDESNDVTDTAQLSVFIRGVTPELDVYEELLDVIPLKGTTSGLDIFTAIENLFEKYNLQWCKLVSVSTDGAPAILGRKDAFYGRLLKKLTELNLPPIPLIHCIVHRENLCAKTLKMKHVMDVVVKIINTIKARALNHRLFRERLEANDSDVKELLYHTEVRFLSRGKSLTRFIKLRNEVKFFF